MLPSILTLAVLIFAAPSPAIAREVSECSCGFEDERTASVYTDSLVVYFNETDIIDPAIFQNLDFAHKKEQGWNSVYKIGAHPENAKIVNTTVNGVSQQALEMILNTPEKNHLVNGAQLQSVRRDIKHGLFEAAMRPAAPWSGGTVLTYGLYYNRSDNAEIDFMNDNDPINAQVANLVNGEWPDPEKVKNFTTLESAGVNPWDSFTNVRLSWNESAVVFHVADNMTRLITKKDRSLPAAGQALQLETWSTGDKTFGKGPPLQNTTRSHVLWVRTFFNSSALTTAQHNAFNERCAKAPRCATADVSLRGYTPFGEESEQRWKGPPKNKPIRKLAGVVAACCSSFGIFALTNVFLRRTSWKKLWPESKRITEISEKPADAIVTDKRKSSSFESISEGSSVVSGTQTPLPRYGTQNYKGGEFGRATPAPSYHTATPSLRDRASSDSLSPARDFGGAVASRTKHEDAKQKALRRISEASHMGKIDLDDGKFVEADGKLAEDVDAISPVQVLPTVIDESVPHDPMDMASGQAEKEVAVVKPVEEDMDVTKAAAEPVRVAVQPVKRIDYLAGLTALACIGVTLHHFGQTFWPFVMNGYGPRHYSMVEKWLNYTVGGVMLSGLWIGPFFLTATRFLAMNFLEKGNLEDIFKKEIKRVPRLFVPIVIVSLLEYFFISMGVTSSLEWLPSVSYSTWPYVVAQKNFAVYLNNIVELAYIIPNAAPEITSHYCIGILWTIPVQLQFSWVVLAATVVIRDIKNPWKRFGFYNVVIIAGWYARSWSACHWAGLVLSDLEVTYNWRAYLKSRPVARYSILAVASICAGGSSLFGIFNPDWSFFIVENGIHPDVTTGKPIVDTNEPPYPDYTVPTLALLLFSIGLQTVVELSTAAQWFLSLKIFTFLNPMIYCIYLTHGFVFWAWGSWVAVTCNDAGMPYYATLIITFVTSYTLLLLLAMILSPLLEFPTQALMRNIERWATVEPQAKRPTTAPFSKDLVLDRKIKEEPAQGEA